MGTFSQRQTDADGHGAATVPARGSIGLDVVDAWWRAANYLSAGQIYLQQNGLLSRPLQRDDIKPRLLGHWGTAPGLNLVYAHLNRAIVERDCPMLYVCGPGHGGAAMMANAWLEGSYSELTAGTEHYLGQDAEGLDRLLRQFSYPGGVPSHAAPETPGSINEGGELGYSLMHAYGAALDNPDLTVACVIGDGEAETGPLQASWRAHTYLDPARDGAVLPILHLNGYKIASPTPLARIPDDELDDFLRGNGYEPLYVTGESDQPEQVHPRMAYALDAALDRIDRIQQDARSRAAAREAEADSTEPAVRTDAAGEPTRPRWPMIVLRTPKGWTGPRIVDGTPVESTYRAHQVPLPNVRDDEEHRQLLERWLTSYRPDELFTPEGAPAERLDVLRPQGDLRMSASPHAHGGIRTPIALDDPGAFAAPIGEDAGATGTLGPWLAEVVRANPARFRLFGPDEIESNRLQAVFDVTDRTWSAQRLSTDTHLAEHGQVIEALSEHLMQGILEGYLLTGRHGLVTSYEAFTHIVDSMMGQFAKWLEASRQVPWRQPLSSLTYLLSSHVWRQDHNGFSHQDPGFLNVVLNKAPEIVRVYLPPDANTLLHTMRHAFDTHDRINVVVAGKHPQPVWTTSEQARSQVSDGVSIWPWAGTDSDGDNPATPEVVLACAGDVPSMEAVAAAQLLGERMPQLAVRVVNVIDLMRLASHEQHPHGLSDDRFDELFTRDRPVIFAFHGYPSLVHQLTYKHTNHAGFHVHGFQERGTTTTPFDMVQLNDVDRYALAIDAITRAADAGAADPKAAHDAAVDWQRSRDEARAYAYEHGEDPEWITDWRFSQPQH